MHKCAACIPASVRAYLTLFTAPAPPQPASCALVIATTMPSSQKPHTTGRWLTPRPRRLVALATPYTRPPARPASSPRKASPRTASSDSVACERATMAMDDDEQTQPWRRPSRGSSRSSSTSSIASSVASSTSTASSISSDNKPARRTSLRRRPDPLVLDKPLPSVQNKPRRPGTALPLASSSPDSSPISPLAPLPPALAAPPTSLAPLTPLALPQPARLRDWRSVPITRVIRSRSPKDAEVALAALQRVAAPP